MDPKVPRGAYDNSPVGGAEGDRTPDLLIANEALSQLSYSPPNLEKGPRKARISLPGRLSSKRPYVSVIPPF